MKHITQADGEILMRNPEIWIGLIVLGFLLFGAKRMPDAARGLGRSLRIFKAEIKGLDDDQTNTVPGAQTAQQAPQQPAYPAQLQAPVAAPVAQPVAAPVAQPVAQPVAGPVPEHNDAH
jgi:sec-independent protein translocase protein TatA